MSLRATVALLKKATVPGAKTVFVMVRCVKVDKNNPLYHTLCENVDINGYTHDWFGDGGNDEPEHDELERLLGITSKDTMITLSRQIVDFISAETAAERTLTYTRYNGER